MKLLKTKSYKLKANRIGGYIALVSALIIAAIIVLVSIALSQTAFFGRSGTAGTFFKERSRSLAQACANTALLRLNENPSYQGDEIINVGNETCVIFPIEVVAEGRVIKTRGMFQRSYTNYKIIAETDPMSIISWEEVKVL